MARILVNWAGRDKLLSCIGSGVLFCELIAGARRQCGEVVRTNAKDGPGSQDSLPLPLPEMSMNANGEGDESVQV